MWATNQGWVVAGKPLRVRTQDSDLATVLDHVMGGFEQTSGASRGARTFQVTKTASKWKVYRDSCQVSAHHSPSEALVHLLATINRIALEDVDDFAVHSGVVQMGSRIVAFPAVSGGGKTTLTAAMILAGADYVSDEALVIDGSKRVVPYPKPLALSEWSCRILGLDPAEGERLLTPFDLDAELGAGGPLTDVVIAEFGSPHLELTQLSNAEAVRSLLAHSFNHYKDPARAFRIATDVAREVQVWRLQYDDPMEAAKLLAASLD